MATELNRPLRACGRATGRPPDTTVKEPGPSPRCPCPEPAAYHGHGYPQATCGQVPRPCVSAEFHGCRPRWPRVCSGLITEPRGQQARIRQSWGAAPGRSSGRLAAPHAQTQLLELRSQRPPPHAPRPHPDHGRARRPQPPARAPAPPSPRLRQATKTAHGEAPQRFDVTPNSKAQRPPVLMAPQRFPLDACTCAHTHLQIHTPTHSHL